MRRNLLVGFVLLLVFASAAAVGFSLSSELFPERVRRETERRLAAALHAPVRIGSARLVLGLGLRLVAEDVSLWPDPDGEPGLWVGRASASVRPLALLRGRFELHSLLLVGARLRAERDGEGRLRLPWLARREREQEPRVPHPEELLSPLIAIETAVRRLVAAPRFTDALEVRESTLLFTDRRAGGAGEPLRLSLRGLRGQLRRGRLLGDTRLHAAARLYDAEGERGRIEWQGRRSRRGEIQLAMATTALEMEAVERYLRALSPRARVGGVLSGVVTYQTAQPGDGRLELDLVVRDLASVLRPDEATAYGPVTAARAEAQAVLSITPERVELERSRVASGGLELGASGTVARPLRPASVARLSLQLGGVDFTGARKLLGWLPRSERDSLAAVVEPIETGRLVHFESTGIATLEGWGEFLGGRTLRLPLGFSGSVEVADGTVRVGRSDRLEALRGRANWEGDRVHVTEAHASLRGKPLPVLELSLDGVSHLFATDAERRELRGGALPLQGLSALWESLRPEGSDGEPPMRAVVALEIDYLEHPMFLSPIENLRASIERADRGVHITVDEGTWAGVPVRAEADWLFEPSEEVRVHIAAEPARPHELAPLPRAGWAAGRFSVGALAGGSWRQTGARGRFTARAGRVFLHDVEIGLEPSGRLGGSIALELSEPDAVPFDASFVLDGGDVPAVMHLFGLGGELVSGSVDLAGTFEGWLQPDVPILNELSGLLSIRARDGVVNREIPPVLAIALASESFNPFARRDVVRYANLDALLDFSGGSLRARHVALDGPDLRVLARGDVDLARPPNEIRAEVTLFLFRQLDRAIEKIPLLNVLLLGSDEHLQAAYYELSGPWDQPVPKLIPLRSLASGPATNVLMGVPNFLLKSIEAIETMLGVRKPEGLEALYLERAQRRPQAS